MKLKIGESYSIPFPFIRSTFRGYDEEGTFEVPSWKPGCKVVPVHPDDSELMADGIGELIMTVVDIHKPGNYPERVFFTRRWINPSEEEFGKNKLHITTTQTFKRRLKGYAHSYRLDQ